jgi:hypothetical protein
VAFIDTETTTKEHDGSQILGLRMWVGGIVDRRPDGAAKVSVRTADGTDRASLARWIDAQTVGKSSLYVFAHNLGFDLTVSRLPDFLHRLGWGMTQWSFAGRNVTGRMRRRSKGLTFCDSTSWLPHPLDHIGRQVGRLKGTLPAPDAPEAEWLEYCQGDVLILAEAVLQLMDWWDREQLGHWSTSGPGCGWNSARHLSPKRMVLVNDDPVGVASDRAAIRGGRRDVTRVGECGGGPFALVDFSNAYLTVAATQLLPKGRLGHYESFPMAGGWLDSPRFGVVADCEVETPTPRYPLRTGRGVFYPVGRFRTTLATPEIKWARQAGHLRAVGSGFVHDMGYPLAGWARWALAQLDPANKEVPAVVRLMVKQWGRSVVGKFAARSSSTTDKGPSLWPGWHLERGTTGASHSPAADVHIAGRHWWVTFDQEGENSYPALLAWVESYVRVALGRMLEALGDDMWVCCDTDGAVIDLTKARSWLRSAGLPAGRSWSPTRVAEGVCEAVSRFTAPLIPRVKLISHTLTVSGPQHYAGDTFERAAGRPGKPEVDASGELHMWRWPKVAWQMEHGTQSGFVRTEGHWTAPATLAHRWVLVDGSTRPVVACPGSGDGSVIAEYGWNRGGLARELLDDDQAPALRGLY